MGVMLSIDLFRVVSNLETVVTVFLLTGVVMMVLPLMAMFLFDIGGYMYLKYTNKLIN